MTQDNYIRNTNLISVVDDDESIRVALESLLRSNGYEVRTYADALQFVSSNSPGSTSCLISDIQMPGMSGVQMYEELRARGYQIPVIFITGYPGAPPDLGDAAKDLIAYLPKPFQADKLMACVELALDRKN